METTVQTHDEIRNTVIQCLSSVIGDDAVAVLTITDDTALFSDLELGSIEVVSLVEKLNEYYPLADEFFAWVSKLSHHAMAHLTIGDVVDFIEHAHH